jgi:hypothetical protein
VLGAALVAAPPARAGLFHHASPTPTPSPTPPPPADPAVTLVARRQFVAWQAGHINRRDYSATLSAQTDDAKVQQSSVELGQLGALQSMQYLGPITFYATPSGTTVYLYKMVCANGFIYEQLALDPRHTIQGIVFRDTIPTPAP